MHGADINPFHENHSHSPNNELHLAFACCVYKDGHKLGVLRAKDPMRSDCHSEEIFLLTACLQDYLPNRQREVINCLVYIKYGFGHI